MICKIEFPNFSRLTDCPVPIATNTWYAIILVLHLTIDMPCDINKHVLNHMLPRSTRRGDVGEEPELGPSA
jgi:hypothetical protein